MGKGRERKAASEQKKDLKEAHDYVTSLGPSIRSAAKTNGVPYGILREEPVHQAGDAHNSLMQTTGK